MRRSAKQRARRKQRSKHRGRQLEMLDRKGLKPISRRGGARQGAGRKPANGISRNGPRHGSRAPIAGRHPVFVTMKFSRQLRRNMRARLMFAVVKQCLFKAKIRHGMRICHFSVQRDHIHLIVEPPGGRKGTGVELALGGAMRALAIRIARQVNKRIGRRGPAFAHRYHSRELTSPLAVKRALHYVIGNRRKHALAEGDRVPSGFIDPCSSADYVPAWSRRPKGMPPPRAPGAEAPVAPPKTWLLGKAWHQKHGGLDAFKSAR